MSVHQYLLLLIALLSCSLSARTWTDTIGRELDAEYVSASAEAVTVKRGADGLVVDIPLAQLSKADVDFVATQVSQRVPNVSIKSKAADGPVPVLDWTRPIGDWRSTPLNSIPFATGKMDCQYTSAHFAFYGKVVLDGGKVRELASFLEGIYETVEAMPLALNPDPYRGERWRVYIYDDDDDYRAFFVAADVMPGSGTYSITNDGALHVLMPVVTGRDLQPEIDLMDIVTSSGRKGGMRGTLYIHPYLDDRFKTGGTDMITAVTQLLFADREPALPPWVIFGLADMVYRSYDARAHRFELETDDMEPYLEQRFVSKAPIPTKDGFKYSGSNKTYKAVVIAPLDEVIAETTNEDFLVLYQDMQYRKTFQDYQLFTNKARSGGILFYYLCHGEGGASGKRLYRYLRAIDNGTPPKEAASILIGDKGYHGLFVDMAKYIEQNTRYEVIDFKTGTLANGQVSKYYQ